MITHGRHPSSRSRIGRPSYQRNRLGSTYCHSIGSSYTILFSAVRVQSTAPELSEFRRFLLQLLAEVLVLGVNSRQPMQPLLALSHRLLESRDDDITLRPCNSITISLRIVRSVEPRLLPQSLCFSKWQVGSIHFNCVRLHSERRL